MVVPMGTLSRLTATNRQMEGGWTLVWSYTFTDYANFDSGSNAVIPRPTWKSSGANTRVSTTVPLSET